MSEFGILWKQRASIAFVHPCPKFETVCVLKLTLLLFISVKHTQFRLPNTKNKEFTKVFKKILAI